MVYPLMRMDHARRKKYALTACFLHAISAFLIFINEANHFLVLPTLTQGITQFVIHHKLVSYLIGFTPFVTALLHLLMFVVHVYSIVAFAEQRQAYSRWRPQYLKLLISILITSLVISLLISVVTVIHYRMFDTFLRAGIVERMIGFGTKQTDRSEMNWLQEFFECCGVFGYEDWFPLTASNSLLESRLITDRKNQWSHCTRNGCYLPHSCCINNQLKCSSLILLQNYTKNEEVGKHRAKEWFHFTGCFSEVKRRLTIVSFVVFSVFTFVIQCITLLYSQIASTSYSMVSYCDVEDATAVLPAWILPFPPPYPQTIIKKCQELLKQGRDFQELLT
ncbi:putative integral membrane protein [Acanthocheilonema viteae]